VGDQVLLDLDLDFGDLLARAVDLVLDPAGDGQVAGRESADEVAGANSSRPGGCVPPAGYRGGSGVINPRW
jgi:hypothetical protein